MVEYENRFEAKITKRYLYPFLRCINLVNSELRLCITPEGFKTTLVDNPNITMVDTILGVSKFEKYSLHLTDPVIGIDITAMLDILADRCIKPDDSILLEWIPAKEQPSVQPSPNYKRSQNELPQLKVSVNGVCYMYSTIDPCTIRKKPTVPILSESLSIEMVVPVTHLLKCVRAINNVKSEYLRLGVNLQQEHPSVFYVENGNDSGLFPVEVLITSDELPYFKNHEKDPKSIISTLYSTDYLDGIIKGFRYYKAVYPNARICLGSDYPLIISLEMDGGNQLEYLLAPRIDFD